MNRHICSTGIRILAKSTKHFIPARFSAAACVALLAGGCTVVPVSLDRAERDKIGAELRTQLFAEQEPISAPLTLSEATARAIKYQAEYRVRLMEEAAALGQLNVAQFDLLPKLAANAGYSTRNNDSFGFGFSPSGTVATNPSASSERSHTTGSIGFTWSLLDFGLSYFRAQQLADQKLIADERRRKALQILVQDVRLAWWRATAAQKLLPMIDAFYEEIDLTIEKTRIIESRKLLPPLQTASLRRALLDLAQQISLRRQDLAQAQIEFAAMISAPPGSEVRVAPVERERIDKLDLAANIDLLETTALRNRPELAEEAYKARISESEAKKGLLALVPNLNLSLDRSYDSNRFLVNNAWNTAGLSAAMNLMKVFSLPAMRASNEAQKQLDSTRKLATAVAVITQTRVAAVRFGLLSHEYGVWEEATRDDEQIVKFLSSSADVGIDTELELIRAKARLLVSTINRDLVYANLEAALGRLYASTGLDVLPETVEGHGVAQLAASLRDKLDPWEKQNFAQRRAESQIPVALGDVQGVPAEIRVEFVNALRRVLLSSRLSIVEPAEASLRVLSGVRLEPSRQGSRPVTVRVSVVDARNGAVRFSSEFRTALSEPVDPEQWRTLGEGAAYRVAGPIARIQAGRSLPSYRPESDGTLAPRGSVEFLQLRPAEGIAGLTRAVQGDTFLTEANPGNAEPVLLRLTNEIALLPTEVTPNEIREDRPASR